MKNFWFLRIQHWLAWAVAQILFANRLESMKVKGVQPKVGYSAPAMGSVIPHLTGKRQTLPGFLIREVQIPSLVSMQVPNLVS